jgi:hypothetical protein
MHSSRIIASCAAIALLVLCGCTSTHSSNTARTGVEQMLISNAVDQSLSKIDFQPFAGHDVFLDAQYTECVDKPYVVGAIRHRLALAGAHLVESRDNANVVLELRTGAVGTDNSESFIGVPEIALPGMVTLPEVRVLTRSHQSGVAKLGLVAIDPRTGAALGSGGQTLAQSQDSNWYLLGMGPMQTGSVRDEVERSTSGSAMRVGAPLPTRVVFATPSPAIDEGDPELRYTGSEEEVDAEEMVEIVETATVELDAAAPAAHWYER